MRTWHLRPQFRRIYLTAACRRIARTNRDFPGELEEVRIAPDHRGTGSPGYLRSAVLHARPMEGRGSRVNASRSRVQAIPSRGFLRPAEWKPASWSGGPKRFHSGFARMGLPRATTGVGLESVWNCGHDRVEDRSINPSMLSQKRSLRGWADPHRSGPGDGCWHSESLTPPTREPSLRHHPYTCSGRR